MTGLAIYRKSTLFRIGAACAIVIILSGLRLTQSLWTDEFGTWWCSQDIRRAILGCSPYHPHPLYYLLTYGLTELFGSSEIVLRLLSVISSAVAAECVYRIVHTLTERKGQAALTWIFFLFAVETVYHGSDARPYAFANMFILANIAYSLSYCYGETKRQLSLSILLSTLASLSHPLFTWSFIFPIILLILKRKESNFKREFSCLLIGVSVAALGYLLGQGLGVKQRLVTAFGGTPQFSIEMALFLFLPTSFAYFAIPVQLINFARNSFSKITLRKSLDSRGVPLLLAWALGAGGWCLLISMLSGTGVFWDRYLLPAVSFWIVVFAIGLYHLLERFPSVVKAMVVSAVLIVLILQGQQALPRTEHWREATLTVRGSCEKDGAGLVLLRPTHVEISNSDLASIEASDESGWIAAGEYYSLKPCSIRLFTTQTLELVPKYANSWLLYVAFNESEDSKFILDLTKTLSMHGLSYEKVYQRGSIKILKLMPAILIAHATTPP